MRILLISLLLGQEVLYFRAVHLGLSEHDHDESVAKDEVGVDLNDEEVDRGVEGLHLDVEVGQDGWGDCVDDEGQQFNSQLLLRLIGAVAGVPGQYGHKHRQYKDDDLPTISLLVPDTAPKVVFSCFASFLDAVWRTCEYGNDLSVSHLSYKLSIFV